MKQVVPVVQNVYRTNKRLTFNDILLILGALRNGNVRFSDFRTKRQTLIKLLEGEGFSLDEPSGRGTTALKQDAQNVEAYLSPNGSGSVRLTIAAGKSEYGIHPNYLNSLVSALQTARFKVEEVEGAKRLYHDRPYEWEKPPGLNMLAGAKSYKSNP